MRVERGEPQPKSFNSETSGSTLATAMAAEISASVGDSAHNRPPDVRTVQDLLNRVPLTSGGPLPPLKVDGLCYGKTLSAIEGFQKKGCGFKWPDRRIDPGGRTWNELVKCDAPPESDDVIHCYPTGERSASGSSLTQLSFGSGGAAVSADDLVAQALGALPTATVWVHAALNRLLLVRSKIERFHVYTPDEIKFFEPVETHFKVRIPAIPDTDARERIDKITRIYQRVQRALGQAPTRLVGDPSSNDKAYAPLGGFDHADKMITIGMDFANSNANMRSAVLIHEAAHFVERSCGHAASELPSPNGSAITDASGTAINPSQKNYKQLDFALALRNAYSFAQCAMHNGLGIDKRPP